MSPAARTVAARASPARQGREGRAEGGEGQELPHGEYPFQLPPIGSVGSSGAPIALLPVHTRERPVLRDVSRPVPFPTRCRVNSRARPGRGGHPAGGPAGRLREGKDGLAALVRQAPTIASGRLLYELLVGKDRDGFTGVRVDPASGRVRDEK